MENWNAYLSYNSFSANEPEHPVNALKLAFNRLSDKSVTPKSNIYNLNQAEDKQLEFRYTFDSRALTDVVDATFQVFDLSGQLNFAYTLADNISFDGGVFHVNLSANETSNMNSKYLYEFWARDSLLDETLLFKGVLKFKPTSGRFL